MPEELIGQVLGQYRIVEEVGKSGAARLYRAQQAGSGRTVAVRVFPPAFLEDEAFLKRFQQQADQIARLHHPNLVSVFEAGEGGDHPFLVTGYIVGQSLSDRLESLPGGLSAKEAARIVTQVCAGLDHAHQLGIAHRNVKPANILLADKGSVYLTNFGLPVVNEARSRHARKQYIGTPAYMAPELTAGVEPSAASDIYALGASLFHVLTTRPPFDSGNQVAVLLAHVQQSVPDIREYRPDLPESMQPIIERAMAKAAPDRFDSAGGLAEALNLVVRQMGPTAEEVPGQVSDPLRTAKVQAAVQQPPASQRPPDEHTSETTINVMPKKMDLPPLSGPELQTQTAGRRRAESADQPEPATEAPDQTREQPPEPIPAPAPPPSYSARTVVGSLPQAESASVPALPHTGKETNPASRTDLERAKAAAVSTGTLAPAQPKPERKRGGLTVVIVLSVLAVLCALVAGVVVILVGTGVIAVP